MTLTEFLLARIAEDEAAGTRLVLRDPLACPICGDAVETFVVPAVIDGRRPNRADRVEPCGHELTAEQSASCRVPVTNARVLAECEAKRRIVEEHRLITDPARLVKVWRDPTPGVACERCANDPLGDRPIEDIGPCDTLLFLAAIYSDHPDYDKAWRS